jgi:hypothetical protein
VYAEQARALFETTARRLGLKMHMRGEAEMGPKPAPEPTTFARPPRKGQQLKLL